MKKAYMSWSHLLDFFLNICLKTDHLSSLSQTGKDMELAAGRRASIRSAPSRASSSSIQRGTAEPRSTKIPRSHREAVTRFVSLFFFSRALSQECKMERSEIFCRSRKTIVTIARFECSRINLQNHCRMNSGALSACRRDCMLNTWNERLLSGAIVAVKFAAYQSNRTGSNTLAISEIFSGGGTAGRNFRIPARSGAWIGLTGWDVKF